LQAKSIEPGKERIMNDISSTKAKVQYHCAILFGRH